MFEAIVLEWLFTTLPLTNVQFQITHPAGCFAQFINFFGEHVFTLWKFALLQRRIIFFSPPPIGVVCYRGEGGVCVCIAHVGYTCMSVGIWVCLHVYVLWVWVRVCVSERERVLECAFLWFVNILCTFYSSFDIMLLGLHNVSPLFVWLFFILVYCACCLGSHNVQGLGDHELRPHFYINVADIETLENEISFIACELFVFLQEQPWSLKTWLFGFFKCLCALHPSTQ